MAEAKDLVTPRINDVHPNNSFAVAINTLSPMLALLSPDTNLHFFLLLCIDHII